MIRVEPAPEPAHFDEQVRQPGLSALSELIGEGPTITRSGPRIQQLLIPKKTDRSGTTIREEKLVTRREEIPSDRFPPKWTAILPDLLKSYRRICAYTCFYIEEVTGAATVDHMLPKSSSWEQAYEWSNYRLACAFANTYKSAAQDALDPFAIEDGWFQLELVGFQVIANPELPTETRAKIEATIARLHLNADECRRHREDTVQAYTSHDISLRYMERRAPFIARELRRQGKLLA